MRYMKLALVLWIPLAAMIVAVGAGPAAAQSSLAEVKCSFFDDYVDSGYERAAGMPLAIAVAGDELPSDVASAFSALEDGDPVTDQHRAAIVGFFDPACEQAAPVDAAAFTPVTTTAAGSTAASAAPPEQLASTGMDLTTALITGFGIALLAAGVWVLQLDQHSRTVIGISSLFPGASKTPASLPVAKAHTHRFWLLDDDAQ